MFNSFHFTINLVGYSVDPKLTEKHNFISIAISDGSNHDLTEIYRCYGSSNLILLLLLL